MNSDDWRLTNQIEYLKEKKLKYVEADKDFDNLNHEHCEFCFIKFNYESQCGYFSLDNYHYICENCFNDFNKMFKWEIIDI